MAKMKCGMSKSEMAQRGRAINEKILSRGKELNSKKSGQSPKPKKKTYV